MGAACGGRAVASDAGDFAGVGFGVLSDSGEVFFFPGDFSPADFVGEPVFFFPDFDFAEGVFDALAFGVG